jgi:molybdenum cofactor guanylyltransferase
MPAIKRLAGVARSYTSFNCFFSMIADCTAIILAGGDSQRMGRDKANLLLGEKTLLQRVIAAMQQVFPHVIVSVRQPRPEIDLPQVCDEQPNEGMPVGAGPLAGLAASLGHVTTPWAFVVACDMPFVEPAMVELLAGYRFKPPSVPPCQGGSGFSSPDKTASHSTKLSKDDSLVAGYDKGRPGGVWCQAVVPVVQGHPQPLVAFYAGSCLDTIRGTIRAHLAGGGKNSLRAVLEQLRVRYVDETELLKADPAMRSFFDLDTPQDVAIAMRRD